MRLLWLTEEKHWKASSDVAHGNIITDHSCESMSRYCGMVDRTLAFCSPFDWEDTSTMPICPLNGFFTWNLTPFAMVRKSVWLKFAIKVL